jgi:pyruvate,water dikinase
MNASFFFKYLSTEWFAEQTHVMDPYLASIVTSKDCDRETYRMKKLPKGVGLGGLFRLMRQVPLRKLYSIGRQCKKDPEKASSHYQDLVRRDKENFDRLAKRGPKMDEGLQSYAHELFVAMSKSFEFELGTIFFVILPLFKELDKHRREGKTEEIREEYGALCGGYEGDELMKMNVDLYRLAQLLPKSVWDEYQHSDLHKLAVRIQHCLESDTKSSSDLPSNFLDAWKHFLSLYGWDGQNQLFPSCPRYNDSPVLLLINMKQSVGPNATSPVQVQEGMVRRRREVMALHEQRAREKNRLFHPFARSMIGKRNASIEHLMWIRNAPKLHLAQMCGILRAAVLKVEEGFLQTGRLEQEGDIWHLDLKEIDQSIRENEMEIKELVRPLKVVYERALRVNQCPLLVDSRCRILKPDPPELGDHEEGTLVGAAISPGVVQGRVRVLGNPSDYFESGEILCAVVTGPAWTPLFAGASGIILQMGGVLQHGALCAREFGKPAVSNIDIHSKLKNGMLVEVDGNQGIVKILEG